MNMLVIVEAFTEKEKLRRITSGAQYNKIEWKLTEKSCPALVDLETGVVKEVKIDYNPGNWALNFTDYWEEDKK